MRLGLAWCCFLLGCAPPLTMGQPCALNSDCDEPYACIEGRCGSECSRHADCTPVGVSRCVLVGAEVGRCVVDVGEQCTASRACPYDTLECVDRRCFNRCVDLADCPSDGACVGGYCVAPAADGGVSPDGG